MWRRVSAHNHSEAAFSGCEKLESIAIPATVTSIARNAFARCTRLSDKTFVGPTSLTAIHMRVFRHCVNLRVIVIPLSLVMLPVNCFNRCTGLAEVSRIRLRSAALRISCRVPVAISSGSVATRGCASLDPPSRGRRGVRPFFFSCCPSRLRIPTRCLTSSLRQTIAKSCAGSESISLRARAPNAGLN
jgi:hypothetical protein